MTAQSTDPTPTHQVQTILQPHFTSAVCDYNEKVLSELVEALEMGYQPEEYLDSLRDGVTIENLREVHSSGYDKSLYLNDRRAHYTHNHIIGSYQVKGDLEWYTWARQAGRSHEQIAEAIAAGADLMNYAWAADSRQVTHLQQLEAIALAIPAFEYAKQLHNNIRHEDIVKAHRHSGSLTITAH